MTQTGNIFNIQRFTIHDGPGLRTELFLKGCPLRCKWCSNPESFMTFSQPGVYRTKCISEEKCGECKEVCSGENVLQFFEGKIGAIDRQKCLSSRSYQTMGKIHDGGTMYGNHSKR